MYGSRHSPSCAQQKRWIQFVFYFFLYPRKKFILLEFKLRTWLTEMKTISPRQPGNISFPASSEKTAKHTHSRCLKPSVQDGQSADWKVTCFCVFYLRTMAARGICFPFRGFFFCYLICYRDTIRWWAVRWQRVVWRLYRNRKISAWRFVCAISYRWRTTVTIDIYTTWWWLFWMSFRLSICQGKRQVAGSRLKCAPYIALLREDSRSDVIGIGRCGTSLQKFQIILS